MDEQKEQGLEAAQGDTPAHAAENEPSVPPTAEEYQQIKSQLEQALAENKRLKMNDIVQGRTLRFVQISWRLQEELDKYKQAALDPGARDLINLPKNASDEFLKGLRSAVLRAQETVDAAARYQRLVLKHARETVMERGKPRSGVFFSEVTSVEQAERYAHAIGVHEFLGHDYEQEARSSIRELEIVSRGLEEVIRIARLQANGLARNIEHLKQVGISDNSPDFQEACTLLEEADQLISDGHHHKVADLCSRAQEKLKAMLHKHPPPRAPFFTCGDC